MYKSVSVKVLKLNEKAVIPKQGSKFSAGSDLYSIEDCILEPNTRKLVSTGISLQFTENVYGRIAPRSGLAFKNGIDVMAGVIDSDYTGEIKVLLYNTSDVKFEIQSGDRIAQIIFESYKQPSFVEVYNLDSTERSSSGFGSTGIN